MLRPEPDRTGDPTLFRRVLYRLSYLAKDCRKDNLATLTGLEPATSAVTGRRANQLRHRALFNLSVPLRHDMLLYITRAQQYKSAVQAPV